MGKAIVQDRGITSYVEMLDGDVSELLAERQRRVTALDEQRAEHQNLFFRVDIVPELYQGVVTITQSYGIGRLGANSVLLGWLSKEERAIRYFKMLHDLSDLQKSLFIMKYDEHRRFGRRKNIHIWWGGLNTNGGMMLLLAYLTISNYRWNRAKVTLVTVVESDDLKTLAEQRLAQLFESARFEASTKVIVREGRGIRTLMSEHSGGADLVFLGLRLPTADEDPVEVFQHYDHLLEVLPTTILVHSAGNFDASTVLFDEVSP